MIPKEQIQNALNSTINKVEFTETQHSHSGKIRESFVLNSGKRAIVVTDRISSFDFILGTIPYKGQILNQIAAWWFKKLDEIEIPHHLLSTPHPNISVVKNAKVLPVEIIVRGYLTGSTKTSAWYAYQKLDRKICGLEMPEGMKKNEKFETPIITPTTKPETGHDVPLSREEIIEQGLVDEETYKKAEDYALKMFAYGQKIALERGLILVDTKYEMGIDETGDLIVVDEVHTPDSSRYWINASYNEQMKKGEGPESLDKEFVREMLVASGYDIDSDDDPSQYLTDSIRVEAAQKYIALYEKMTNEKFEIEETLGIFEILKRL